jgi:hypothetical protein
MPVYCFNQAAIQRYFDQLVLGLPITAARFLEIAEPVLRHTAISRRVSIAMSLNTAPVSFTDDCSLTGAGVRFDVKRFTQRFLNKAAAYSRLPRYEELAARIDEGLPPAFQHWLHAEDFLDLLHWLVLRAKGPANTVARPLLARALYLAVPLSELAAQRLFLELHSRLSALDLKPTGATG